MKSPSVLDKLIPKSSLKALTWLDSMLIWLLEFVLLNELLLPLRSLIKPIIFLAKVGAMYVAYAFKPPSIDLGMTFVPVNNWFAFPSWIVYLNIFALSTKFPC